MEPAEPATLKDPFLTIVGASKISLGGWGREQCSVASLGHQRPFAVFIGIQKLGVQLEGNIIWLANKDLALH